ncbi:hypothetical protein AAU57_10490 [Nonlabens sp. YIK11]|uniref:hypothetical protein n=1 Tax=Nonlabens sp. YIK11 TaxID=1453349 RepID=UPI0006DCDE8A|nr:hypothetical protein [Nonlabens sp. YIK11]KQC33707.1 hypothetical protein AAU57_10490 [Nonlabens sp. YIK11]
MIQLIMSGMSEFIVIAIIVAVIIYGINLFNDHKDTVAIKLRKDGKHEYHKVPAEPKDQTSIMIKIAVFILIASVLYIPLDFILNRS